MRTGRLLAARTDDFIEHTEKLWQAYQSLGPGKLERSYFDDVEAAAAEVEHTIKEPNIAAWLEQVDRGIELRDALQTQTKQLSRLSRACACTPQGLSFITGEAGLIPRRDQHEAFESGLATTREIATELGEERGGRK